MLHPTLKRLFFLSLRKYLCEHCLRAYLTGQGRHSYYEMKLNEHSNGVQTIFSLSGYRAFHRWRAAEVAAIDARASSNSLAALEAHGRAQAGEIDADAFSSGPARRRSRTPPR